MDAEAVDRLIRVRIRRQEIRIPSVLWSGVMLFSVRMALKFRGFGWTVRWIRRRIRGAPKTSPVDTTRVKATEHAVAMAGALYPGRALCLEQSLVLYYVLRRQGVDVKFAMGVQPHPFLAHAWVEYGDEPINDVIEHVKQFARLPDELS